MKKLSLISYCLITAATLAAVSCNKNDGPTDEEILHRKITDIIPQQFIDTLVNLGLPVYTETNPPNVEGSYYIDPFLLRATNIPTDVIGNKFISGKFKLFNQHTDDFGIDLIGEYLLNASDTSITTAVAGSGNHFTVYGKVQSTQGRSTAPYAILFSGIKNGENLDSLVVGIVNIDDSLDVDHIFIKEGQARISYDGDYVSEPIDFGDDNTLSIHPSKEKASAGGRLNNLK